ncbi:MAG: sugar ABC transporter ATP-binding protein, partial [Pseudomonadota bacterium]
PQVLVEPAGWETHLHARISGRTVRAISTARLDLAPGDTVALAPDTVYTHLFDAGTGARL